MNNESRGFSIGGKLMLMLGSVVVLAAMVMVFQQSWSLQKGLDRYAQQSRLENVRLLASNISGGVRWNKVEIVRKSYERFVTNNSDLLKVSTLSVYDQSGNKLSSYQEKNYTSTYNRLYKKYSDDLRDNQNIYHRLEKHTVVLAPVTDGKSQAFVGTLIVVFDETLLDDFIVGQITSSVVIALCGLFVLLLAIYFFTRRLVLYPLNKVVTLTRHLAEGDLTQRIDTFSKDEFGFLVAFFNNFVGRFQSIIGNIAQSARQVDESANSAQTASIESEKLWQSHLDEISQISTATTQMSASVAEVAKNASDAADATVDATNTVSHVDKVANTAINHIENLASETERVAKVMQRLESESDNIGSVLDVIRGVADQTNLLALNAAIEAARAGEQGRGFAVVADEVRTLASRTQESTEEIQNMIENLQIGTKEAAQAMQQGRETARASAKEAGNIGKALRSISDSISTISDMNNYNASAAKEQSSVANTIRENVEHMSELTSSVVSKSQTVADSCEDMTMLSRDLTQLTTAFKIK